MVGLTVEIKLCFRDGLVWMVGLTVEIKLCFRDGLVWTAGLTVDSSGEVRTGPDCHRSDSSPRLLETENAVFKFVRRTHEQLSASTPCSIRVVVLLVYQGSEILRVYSN